MYLLRTFDGVGFTLTDEEAEALKQQISTSDYVEVQGSFLRVSQIIGIYTEEASKQVLARDRGLIYHRGEMFTKSEMLGRPVSLPERTDVTKRLENKKS